MTTTPYDPRAVREVPNGVPHVFRAELWDVIWGGFPLDIAPGSSPTVTFDEGWVPHIQGRITIADPGWELRSLIDPLREPHVILSAGYVYGDVEDVHPLAALRLVAADFDRPDNTVELTLESSERLLLDDAPTFDDSDDTSITYPAGTVIREAIADVLLDHASIVLDVAPDVPYTQLTADAVLSAGDDYWEFLVDLADRIDSWLYDDGTTFRLRARPQLASQSAARFVSSP